MIEELAQQVAERDAQIAQMQQALRAAGLLPETVTPVNEEGEAESRSVLRTPPVVNPTRQGSTFKAFMECKPPTFKGGEDSLLCVRWLRKMEQVFRSAYFTEDQKVNYAVLRFEGEALEWWDSVDQSLTEATRRAMTWERFSRKVKERYCSSGSMHRAEREFLALQKGDMTIGKYNVTFNEKLQFARDYCPTEEKLVQRYVEGLPYEYRATVRLQATLEAAMDEARRVEDDLSIRDRATAKTGEKRKWDGQSGSSKKQYSPHDTGNQNDKPLYCPTCHSSHRGPCSSRTKSCNRCGKMGHRHEDCKSTERMCYNCRQMGHVGAQCPNPKFQSGSSGKNDEAPTAKARVFHLRAEGS